MLLKKDKDSRIFLKILKYIIDNTETSDSDRENSDEENFKEENFDEENSDEEN